MAEQNTYSNYSVADIERYLGGQMNAREMHDMELAALQDPFLSDAIEGYKTSPFTTSYTHLSEIETLLSTQKEQAKIIPLPAKRNNWWKIAATAVVITGIGIAGWLRMDTPGNYAAENKIAATVAKPADTARASLPPPLSAQAEVKPAEEVKKASTSSGVVKANNGALTFAKDKQMTDTTTYYAIAPASKPAAESSYADASTLAGNDLREKKDSINATANLLSGRVNGISNNVYSNVASPKGPIVQNLPTTNNNKQFETNFKPKGELSKLADSVDRFAGEGFVAGYQTADKNNNASLKRVAPATQNSNVTNLTVALTPTPSFDTVAITYLNNKRFKSKMVSDTSLFPQGGWESFRDYVYRKLHKEIDTTDEDVVAFGDVEVEFTVDNLGNASNLKITKSLDKQRDAEALELVRQWPGWIASKKQKKGKVVIQF